jgi:uncharacterized delta-60 repeat protein
VQYNPNGSLDTSFDNDGKALSLFDDYYNGVNAIAKQPDGKYLVTCFYSNSSESSDFAIRRYNEDISLDTTFGTNGKVLTTFDTGLNEAQSVQLLPNGKIITVGKSMPLADVNGQAGTINSEFAISKYNANGTLDVTFDGDGKVTTKFEYGTDELKSLLILPDDKFIAVGTSRNTVPNNAFFSNIVFSKYNSNGTLDLSFGNLGKVVPVFGENVYTILNALIQSDGKILINAFYSTFGSNETFFELIRYNSNGSLDTTFGNNGKISTGQVNLRKINSVNGKLLFTGVTTLPSGNNGYVIVQYNENGTIDNAFGVNGVATFNAGNSPFGFSSLAIQQEGKIIVSGNYFNGNGQLSCVTLRYTINGILDNTFGINGVVTTPIPIFVNSNFVQSDGKIIVAGTSNNGSDTNFSTVKYNSNGTIDTTYGINGITFSILDNYNQINSIILQPDNKILVALSQYNPEQNPNNFKVKRINTDGNYDNDFGGQQGITTSFYNGYNEAFSIGLQSNNKIIVAGTTNNGINNDFAITRLTNTVLSVDDFNNEASNVIIYPNPVTNSLNIKTSNELDVIEYSIYNMLGQIIYKSDDNNGKVNTTNFSNGIYNIQIKTNKGIVSKKFIKE